MGKPKLRVVPANESDDGNAHFFVNDNEVTVDEYNKANNGNPALEDDNNTPSQSTTSTPTTLDEVREQLDELPKIDDDTPIEERREIRKKANELSAIAGKLRKKEIDDDDRFDDDEKQILKLYNEGVQNYAIAKRVFKFVNHDTVGQVVLTIRKAHANDYDAVEDVNSTKGYTGVGR